MAHRYQVVESAPELWGQQLVRLQHAICSLRLAIRAAGTAELTLVAVQELAAGGHNV